MGDRILTVRDSKISAAIIIVPPWPMTGSANIFAAMARAHAMCGRKVLLLMATSSIARTDEEKQFRAAQAQQMRFDGVDLATFTEVPRLRKMWGVGRYYYWLRAGCPDTLGERSDLIGSGQITDEARDFIATHKIDVIHVNHCFNMVLGTRLAKFVCRIQGHRPTVICETHDVQAENPDILSARGRLPFVGTSQEEIRRTELNLVRKADILAHISHPDLRYFRHRLPQKKHVYIPPTISPDHEAELRRLPKTPNGEGKLVYVGAGHSWNAQTIIWFLEAVLPLVPDVAGKLSIYGDVGRLVEHLRPDLYRKFRYAFRGRAESLTEIYNEARAVLAIARGGTGSSIKVLEAMCAGRPILATAASLRGFDVEAPPEIISADFPEDLAAAIRQCFAKNMSSDVSRFYNANFSNAAYMKAFTSAFDFLGAAEKNKVLEVA